ncbi:carbohydrate ABC transporter permease [Microbacterium sp. A93]|uniref:carbohydrate ABC transporter permease n=1 Tax=Microbacterium sp. A93 TaxID=3450716 RepID=UPI003F43763F
MSRTRRPRRYRPGHILWGYLMIAPLGIGLGIFYLWPVVQSIIFSFTEWGAFGGQTWVGWDNFLRLAGDAEFYSTLRNSALYTLGVVVSVPMSMVIAAMLNRRGLRGRSVYQVLYFVPMVTMPVAIAIMWRWIYNGDFGVLNAALGAVGIPGTNWISNGDTVMIAMVVVGIWSVIGYNVVILSAGLRGIPPEIYEAASIDGAGGVRQFFSVTVPLVSPTTFFLTVITIMRSIQIFDLVFIMIGRMNPALPEAKTIVYLFFEKTFQLNDKGYGAAIAVVLLILIMLLTLVQFAMQKKVVHYA